MNPAEKNQMATVTTSALLKSISGKIGNTTFCILRKKTYVRQAPSAPSPRTGEQINMDASWFRTLHCYLPLPAALKAFLATLGDDIFLSAWNLFAMENARSERLLYHHQIVPHNDYLPDVAGPEIYPGNRNIRFEWDDTQMGANIKPIFFIRAEVPGQPYKQTPWQIATPDFYMDNQFDYTWGGLQQKWYAAGFACYHETDLTFGAGTSALILPTGPM